MRQILLIDNYDSFSFNLVESFRELGYPVDILQNDCKLDIIKARIETYESEPIIVISPGPGSPTDAGISAELVRYSDRKYPVLGICLGHQVLAEAFGGRVSQAVRIQHGKQSRLNLKRHPLFENIAQPITVGRYHSLAVEVIPSSFQKLAISEDDQTIMMMISEIKGMIGIQFHPESILSNTGQQLLKNCLDYLSISERELAYV